MGMTLAELAAYLVKLGCTDGMNFDGGASASMWMSGQIVNDPCQGERPVANSLFVVRKPDASLEKEQIRDFLAERVAKWWVPDDVVFVESLPVGGTGKVQKADLRKQYGGVFS
jgi:hypothetical protein